ncbi:MAG: hypothetical protein ABEH38_03330 [Flavobacteriales bacterium]
MRPTYWTNLVVAVLLFAFLAAMAAYPPSYDFTSAQDGDWQVSSTWKEAGSPSCSTSDDILIDGDTVTASCDLEINGDGSLVIRNEGYLVVEGSFTSTGQASVEVQSDAGMRVEGDLTVSGNGSFTTNGETDVTGNLNVNGNNATADGSGTLNLGGTGCTNFTGSGTCNGSQPLPVELVTFSSESTDQGIRLKWVTATEDRNDHFLVQRSSDRVHHKTLEEVEGHGTTTQRHRYSYLDKAPPKGDHYYRLVQVDMDGARTVYGPRTANYEPSKEQGDCRMKIVPNPCKGDCHIRFSGGCKDRMKKGRLKVQLYDVSGNKVNANLKRSGGYDSEFLIDTKEDMSPGVYIVRAVSKKGPVASEKMKKE